MYLLNSDARSRPACRWLLSAVVAAAFSAGASSLVLAEQDDAAGAKIHKALGDKTAIEFLETPLVEVADYLSDLHKIKIKLDKKALEDVGVGADTPVTRNLKHVSLRSALRLMLRELDVTYMVDDEVLLITSTEEAETQLTTEFYPVADLVSIDPKTPYSPDHADFDPLIMLIESTIAPDTWDANGGLGAVADFAKVGALVVSQTHDVHEQIGPLLDVLRRLRGTTPGLKAPAAAKTEHDKEEIVRVYRVTNLERLAPRAAKKPKDNKQAKSLQPDYAAAKRSADALAELIKKAVAPKSWTEQHIIRTIPGTLTIRQSRHVHRQIHRLLKKMLLLDGATTLWPPHAAAPAAGDLPVSIRIGERASEARIQKVLGEKTKFELLETPLTDFVDFIRDKHKIEVQIDNRALEDAGIETDVPLTVNLKDISLRSALRLVLREAELTFVIRDEVVLITTPEEAEEMLVTRLYPVGDLVTSDDDSVVIGSTEIDFDPIIELIEATVAPDSWDAAGGPGAIDGLEMCLALAVPQTEEIHEQIARLLQKLRQLQADQFKRDRAARKAAAAEPVLQVYRVAIGVDPTAKAAAKTPAAAKKVGAARPIARNL
ncbi:MAG: hypothetical protein IIA67_02995, partial [Planctomycetes bacterium]|nr:hypothetical protein [Planctomycetota bacterium]